MGSPTLQKGKQTIKQKPCQNQTKSPQRIPPLRVFFRPTAKPVSALSSHEILVLW